MVTRQYSKQGIKMDTDNLSNEAYQGIVVEAEKYSHDLTLQFGVLASDCKDEDEYFREALNLISEIKAMDKIELAEIFFGNPPDIKFLNSTLNRIIRNIDRVKKIPKEKRHYEF